MPVTNGWRRPGLLAALAVATLAAVALSRLESDGAGSTGASGVSIIGAPVASRIAPEPRATSPAELAATLRAGGGPPSPELLRENPRAQAAYDASAQPGDYVTPPSVSVEH